MARMSLTRRLTAATLLLAWLPLTWESALGCVHRDVSGGSPAVSMDGPGVVPGAGPECHGGMTTEGAAGADHGHGGPALTPEGTFLDAIELCRSDSTGTGEDCCAVGCCASPGIPPASAMVASLGASTWEGAVVPPTSPVSGERPRLFRPPIG